MLETNIKQIYFFLTEPNRLMNVEWTHQIHRTADVTVHQQHQPVHQVTGRGDIQLFLLI